MHTFQIFKFEIKASSIVKIFAEQENVSLSSFSFTPKAQTILLKSGINIQSVSLAALVSGYVVCFFISVLSNFAKLNKPLFNQIASTTEVNLKKRIVEEN